MKVKKYQYLVNDNGDVWMVSSVHRNGDVTITHPEGMGEGNDITYSAGQIDSWFRVLSDKVGERAFDRGSWIDPAPYFKAPKSTTKYSASKKSKSGKSKSRKIDTTIGMMR